MTDLKVFKKNYQVCNTYGKWETITIQSNRFSKHKYEIVNRFGKVLFAGKSENDCINWIEKTYN